MARVGKGYNHRKLHRQLASQRFQTTTRKVGLPPGSLVHVGARRVEKVEITVMRYDEQACTEHALKSLDELADLAGQREEGVVTWINIDGLHEVEVLEKIGQCFDIHPLVLEDILNTNQRPKFEDFGQYLYVVLKMLTDQPDDGHRIQSEQVSLIVGPQYVISFQEGLRGDVFDIIRDRIRHAKGRMRKAGADYLAYALLDSIVDQYFLILEELGETIEQLEEELIDSPTRELLTRIHDLRGELLLLRRSVWPLREVIGGLERGETELIHDPTGLYLRDLYDHTIQVIDTIETYHDILAGMMDIYLSSVSNRMNEVMKVLTIISTIFIPLTFIAGVYGMNFEYMPELHQRWGYPLVWVAMMIVTVLMLAFFRRRRWM